MFGEVAFLVNSVDPGRVSKRYEGSSFAFGCRRHSCFSNRTQRATTGISRGLDVNMDGKLVAIRSRISSVKNTQKITEAMRLVAAAKVRRAQEAVLSTRPFSENLQKILGGLLLRLKKDLVDLPLLKERAPRSLVLVVVTGDRGLCGSYNSYIIKRTQSRLEELKKEGINAELFCIGAKGYQFFKRRGYPIRKYIRMGQYPTAEGATEISEYLLAEFLSGEVDRVELLYTRFVSLISSQPSIRTLLPLNPSGLESKGDEIFQLRMKGGKFQVERSQIPGSEPQEFPRDMIFEQDPLQILNAILPLYLNGQILRTLQESVASELASRMSAMSAASDNAKELAKSLTLVLNRARQAAITQEIAEIVGAASALQ
jgi:F-type H+-transporting ATPase subunit gamma